MKTIDQSVLWIAVALVSAGCQQDGPDTRNAKKETQQQRQKAQLRADIERTYASEKLLVALMPKLDDLSKAALNFEIPNYKVRQMFAERVRLVDLKAGNASAAGQEFVSLGIEKRQWPTGEKSRNVLSSESRIWRHFLDDVGYFEYAKFFFIRGKLVKQDQTQLDSDLGFKALARTSSGSWQFVKAGLKVLWNRKAGESKDTLSEWRISEWRTENFEVSESLRRPFAEVLDSALVDSSSRKRARESIHEQLIVRLNLDSNYKSPHEYFDFSSWDRHPGVSVVDVDRDGFDDVYVMARWGKNQFFHNQRDGTFQEVAAKLGLDIKDHSSCAMFADFDNDGDADVFVGRTMARCMYFVNQDGKFVDQTASLVDGQLPYFASSISATDYDEDGLLDVYISTYVAQTMRQAQRGDESNKTTRMSRYFDPQDVNHIDELRSRDGRSESVFSYVGPKNLLLKNIGNGAFKIVNDTPLSLFRHTFQSTWADFDADGDMDVYCANDFAPDNFFRNDGEGVFVDVSRQAGFTTLGLGMGASWGDYDNNGTFDLYVTNMFSKAGRRITSQIPGLDSRFGQIAQGNFLYQNQGDRFLKVSGSDPSSLQVEKAGWSWGSQFIDFNNDGFLDIYALSGFYTPPKGLARPGDT